MAEYAVTDSRSDEYKARAQDFFNSWGLDRSRPEKWTESRDHFSEEDKDLFLRGDHLPESMQNDEGFYMGRQTRDLSKMNEDEYYTGAQKDQVNQAMSELGMESNDSDLKSGRVLSHLFQKHMDGMPKPAEPAEPVVDSDHLAEAKERVQSRLTTPKEPFSSSNEQALNAAPTTNTQDQSYDARNKYTGPNTPESNAVLNAYKEDFAKNYSSNGSNLYNAFTQTALNQQKEDVPDMPSQAQSQQEDEFLRNARGQNLLNA
jgi:hypothetical protein